MRRDDRIPGSSQREARVDDVNGQCAVVGQPDAAIDRQTLQSANFGIQRLGRRTDIASGRQVGAATLNVRYVRRCRVQDRARRRNDEGCFAQICFQRSNVDVANRLTNILVFAGLRCDCARSRSVATVRVDLNIVARQTDEAQCRFQQDRPARTNIDGGQTSPVSTVRIRYIHEINRIPNGAYRTDLNVSGRIGVAQVQRAFGFSNDDVTTARVQRYNAVARRIEFQRVGRGADGPACLDADIARLNVGELGTDAVNHRTGNNQIEIARA